MLYIFDEIDQMDDDIPQNLNSLLSNERKVKVDRLRSAQNKKASVIAYLLLRIALFDLYEIDEPIEFDITEKGKPSLKDYPSIFFNLSHSKNIVACVVSGAEVGVDVQKISPVMDKVAKRVLTDEEYALFNSSCEPNDYFCEIWTIKESFLKMSGHGLTKELREISASSIENKIVYRGMDYFCSICGNDIKDAKIKHFGRDEFERIYK